MVLPITTKKEIMEFWPIDTYWVPIKQVPYTELKRQAQELEVCRKHYWLDTEPTETDVLFQIEVLKSRVSLIHCNPEPPKLPRLQKEDLRVIDGYLCV